MSSQDPDEFDRIVEGLELDTSQEHEFKALEDSTVDFGSNAPDEPLELSEPAEVEEPDEVEVTYRQAPAVCSSGNPFRQWGWLALAALPITLIVFSVANVYVSPAFMGFLIVAAVGLLAYLLLTNPDADTAGSNSGDGSSV
mgnify:CR=1 FL=1